MLGYCLARSSREVLYDCNCELELSDNPRSEIGSSFDKIGGRVILAANTKVCFKSLRIQLEGSATARFQTRIDSRMTNHLRTERFIPNEASTTLESGVTVYLIGRKHDYTWKETERVYLERGVHSFPFEIKLTGQQLPASFQSCYGRIQYRLVLYAISLRETYWHEVPALVKILKSRGYLNLALDPSLLKPLVVTRKKDKSFFSKRPVLKANIVLDQRGYVPGEQLEGQFCVENWTCEEISAILLSFVQKILYFDSKVSKSTLLLLEEQEYGFESKDPELKWDFVMTLPPSLMPTFTKEKKSVEILYFLQFVIQGRGKIHMKGETAIIIGTTKELPESMDRLQVPPSLPTVPSSCNNSSLRRVSTDSTWDTISIQTCSTLPPTYSKVTSRRPSLETLPPAYDVVAGDDNWDELSDGFRPRSSSNMM